MSYNERLAKNIFFYYLAKAVWLPFFWMPILYIYLTQNKGFSSFDVFLLLSIQESALIFLEVPTGVVADKISRKFSVALGYFLTAFPFIFLPFLGNYWVIFFLFIVKSVGKALVSGAHQALMYDTLLELNRTAEYKIIMNKAKSSMLVFSSFCLLFGGLLAQWGYIELTMILPFPFMLIGSVATLFSVEPAISEKAKKMQQSNYALHAFSAVKQIMKSPYLLLFALIFAINDATQVNLKWFYPPIFEKLSFTLAFMGGTTAFLYFIKGILSGVNSRFMSKNSLTNILVLTPIIAAGFIFPAILFTPIVAVVCLLVVSVGTEFMDSSIEEELHDNIESHNRATVMSMVALFGSVMATVMLWIFGYLQVLGGVTVALGFVGGLFLLSQILTLIARKYRKMV